MGRAVTVASFFIIFFAIQQSPAQTNFVQTSALSWGEQTELTRNLDQRRYRIDSTVLGASLNYRSHWLVAQKHPIAWTLGVLGGQSNSESQDATLQYFQRGASLSGVQGSVSYLLLPDSKRVFFGVSLPLVYRQVNFQVPQSGYTYENETEVLSFLALEMGWYLSERTLLIQKLGRALSRDFSLWEVAIALKF